VAATVPILAAAGGIGLAHSVLPDHWLPMAVAARARRDPLSRVARLSLLAGAAHVAVSVVLGGVIIAVGLSLRSVIESRTNLIVGAVLVLTGLAFLLAEATGHTHHHEDDHHHADHDDHYHGIGEGHRPTPRGLALLIPFGAAASPDLTILPVFLAAATLGPGAAIGSLIVFTIVTVSTFVGLTTLAVAGSYQLTSRWLDRYANTMTAVALIAVGALIATNVL
jgi:nickel/cobalt transporter (NicO) family protein